MAHRWRTALAAAALVVLTAACSGDGGATGGAEDLPPPLPEGVELDPADELAPPAPEFSATLIDGTEIAIADLWADRPVVLVFTAGWCEHCATLHEELDEVVSGYDDMVALVGVADEEDTEIEQYVADLGIHRPMALVPIDVWDTYAVSEAPLVALVGPGGKLLRGWPGGVDAEVLREQLDALVPDDAR